MNAKIIEARKLLLKYLKKQIEDKGFTQQFLSDETGFSQSNISRILSAKYPPTLDSLLALCEAANCYIFVIDKEADDDLCTTMRNRWGKINNN